MDHRNGRRAAKLVGYLRVSTDRQAEEGLGLEVQDQKIRAWAKKHGHRLTAVTRDEGISGSNGLDSRIGLGDALGFLRNRQADGLVVYRLDRLARDLVLQEQLLAEIKRMGCQVFSTSGGESAYLDDDPDDPSRRLIRQVLGAVSEYERSMIGLRLRSGRERKAANGGYAGGRPPYGFKAEGRSLVPDPTEQATLRRLRELVDQGCSTRAAARRLNDEGLSSRRGQPWRSGTISAILRRAESR